MVTPIYAALLGLMLIGLSSVVVNTRKRLAVALGDIDNLEIRRCVRAHANLAEYAPIFLILLGYAEYSGLSILWVHLIGLVFLCGRVMHAYSLLKAERYDQSKLTQKPVWRIYGMMWTMGAILTLIFINLYQQVILIWF